MGVVIDGKTLSANIKADLAERVRSLRGEYGRVPVLTVILVGDDPASHSYVRGKIKAAAEVGIESRLVELDASVGEQELLDRVHALNEDDGVDGILVQLPLPKHIDSERVVSAISLEKDVDGFHPLNVARLWLGEPCTLPCTPKGVIRMLDSVGIGLSGCNAVVVGRSNIVGKPMAKLLLDANATVTVAHSRTRDLAEVTRRADVLIAAVGRARFIGADMIKEDAVVIDVGVNRDETTGKLCGDVDFDACAGKASYITKTPGGVGPMTICMLMENTIECFVKRKSR